jgi:uncharacterized membrane protein SpoIIM required for sporulation
MYLFDKLYAKGSFGNGLIWVESVVVSVLGIVCGFLLFPAEASLIGVFLIAFAQARTVELLLNRNRDEVWGGQMATSRANFRLALSLFTLFMGILATYAAATLLVPDDQLIPLFDRQIGDYGGHSITEVVFDDLGGVLGHNAIVLVACFLFSLVYRHGGMLLVLGWNASVWGVVFPYIARTAPDLAVGGAALYFVKSFVSIFPHLLLEAVAYILIAMAGVFLSKALQKYEMGSTRFNQVGLAVLRIAALAAAFLVVASVVEALVAPALISLLFVV